MTIHLPPNLESSILDAVHSGRYASVDDAMAAAASMLVERLQRENAQQVPVPTNHHGAVPSLKPVWEEILEMTADVPDAEWDKLPTDLAGQHDHYLYGTPKRPSA